MPFDVDLNELGLELDEEQAAKVKETLEAKHQEALDNEVTGLKSKRDELLDAQRKMKDQLKQYEGIDPERARQLEEQLAQSEEAKLIADGKLDEVINQRTERMKAEYDRQLQEAQQTAEQAKSFADRFRGRVMSDEMRRVAEKTGMRPEAVEDAVHRASNLFEVNDEGAVVPKEDAGYDSQGNKLTLESWVESLKEPAPHLFHQPEGLDLPGGGRSSAPRAWQEAKSTKDKVEYLKRQRNQ
ncbi:hypothetical protein [Halomonas caseinilytica]|uniref:hypothetical protein n=1 Tax=Halomonas caseinilytica TaxID=438744 RepID=UPI0007E5AE4D|nr:hypothetical protein [Halomonas caseinilytica]SEN65161.1 hypothetical protein SAMN04487952_12314 [Halomonas caseinilytica]